MTPSVVYRDKIINAEAYQARYGRTEPIVDREVLDEVLVGQGVLRFVQAPIRESRGLPVRPRFLTSHSMRSDEEIEREITNFTRFYSDDMPSHITFDAKRFQLDEGMRIEFPEIDPAMDYRGVILHLTGLIVTEQERAFIDRFVESPWLVVVLSTDSMIQTPRDQLRMEREFQRMRTGGAEREQIGPIIPFGFDVDESLPAAEVGRQIARTVDNTFAENAYAAEAALEYLYGEHPRLEGLPVTVIGCSAGAITAPAVAARLGDSVDALVMIGGGADLLKIDRTTSLDWSRRLRVFVTEQDEAPDEVWNAVHEVYLESVQLDPIKLGPRLRHLPTLIIRAGFDNWVPASTGSDLVRVFGKPDRDWHPGGHQTLFYFLEGRAPRVLRWLDRNTPQPTPGAGRASTVAP